MAIEFRCNSCDQLLDPNVYIEDQYHRDNCKDRTKYVVKEADYSGIRYLQNPGIYYGTRAPENLNGNR